MKRTSASVLPWWSGEDLVGLYEVADLVPCRPSGRQVSLKTLERWARIGVAGVVLRTYPIGGRGRGTSKQEVHRFLQAIANVRGDFVA